MFFEYQYTHLMYIILLCGVQIANIWLGRSITEVTIHHYHRSTHTPHAMWDMEKMAKVSILSWSKHGNLEVELPI